MWDTLGSPPENFRFYKFTDHSAEKQPIDLEEDRRNLFQNESLSSVPEESASRTNAENRSQQSKPVSSLKSTSKVQSKANNERSSYELRMNLKNASGKPQSKSMLDHISKQKSTLLLSHKQKSSIKEESQRSKQDRSQQLSNSQKESFLNNVDNEEDEFSQIFIKEINKTEEQMRKGSMFKDKQKGDIYLQTLLEIKEIQREHLNLQKRMWKMAEERGQVSFLYDREDKSDHRFYRNKKEPRKSFKRTQEKSTVKKLGKSLAHEERLLRVQEKCRQLQRRMECGRKTPTLSRLKKKSMSALR